VNPGGDDWKKFSLGCCFDQGQGMAAPDYPAAADWYRRAAEADDGEAANNLASMYFVGRGGALAYRACLVNVHILFSHFLN
jgi:hypothetical protein